MSVKNIQAFEFEIRRDIESAYLSSGSAFGLSFAHGFWRFK